MRSGCVRACVCVCVCVFERAFQAGVDRIDFGAGHFPVVLSERKQYNTHVDGAPRDRALLRGTWFFQRTDGTLQVHVPKEPCKEPYY